jgi:hypothetical protein
MASKVIPCSNCDSNAPALRVVKDKGFCGAVACKAEAFRLQGAEGKKKSYYLEYHAFEN